ncbi:MAG: hypothetical protein DMD41_10655 [Gemmatimonadetes bacterium]|uniref:Uncharacterized protein n=1 Tax=Candidatus Segetimicrobium genomatis TaxID=2569760 RepID=A0A537KIF9_9BACT|nr:MAG: hypothetical protein DMD41_10655 [Gemmatimonadota bacterium]TMI95422.1 MAG: hypothetical protein E6H01_14480 [Terrabacteria group bacterium ANGP1]
MLLQSEISVNPIYEGMPNYLETLAFDESLGFTLMTLFPVGRTGYGNIIEYDCLMGRKKSPCYGMTCQAILVHA